MTFTWVDALIVAGGFTSFWILGRFARTRPLLDCWFQGGLCVFLAAGAVLNALTGGWGWVAFEGAAAVIAGWFWWQALRRRAAAKKEATS